MELRCRTYQDIDVYFLDTEGRTSVRSRTRFDEAAKLPKRVVLRIDPPSTQEGYFGRFYLDT